MSIASEITRIKNAKANIANAIETKGVSVPTNALIDAFASLILQIESGGGSFPQTVKVKTFEVQEDVPSGSTQVFTHNFGAIPDVWFLFYYDSSQIIGVKPYAWLAGINGVTPLGTGYNNAKRAISSGYTVTDSVNSISIATSNNYRFVAGTYYLIAF